MAAPPTLHILHLEDDAADRELVRAALAQAEIPCDYAYAGNEAEFVRALAEDNFDLILSDFTRLGYAGPPALALAQEKCPAVPCLFVSATIGDERAIESLKCGASDYVLKHHLERLGPAVRRALGEAALRRTETRFRDIFDNAVEGIYQSDLRGGLLAANHAMARICGYASPEELRRCVRDLGHDLHVDPPRRSEFDRLLNEHGEVFAYESKIRRKDGTVIWISENARAVRDSHGALLCYESMVTDITARKTATEALRLSEEQRRSLEGQLLQAQKMEAVGQLASGLAHDFNNVLTVVIGYARLLLDRGTMPADAIAPLTQIFTAGTRAANLTRQLLVFSCHQAVNRQVLDLNQIAGDIAEMLRRLIGDHITLDLALTPGPCPIEVDAGMMEQVIMNLAVNARDAMPEGGTLTITTELVTITDATTRHQPAARPGAFACLSVRDTGTGIPPGILDRVFEPFFTTKQAGKGTGLGLAMVFGIVQQHHGWIELESLVDRGTCFRILLPAASPAYAVPVRPPDQLAAASRGSETILLVEDEVAVREYAAAVLRSHGYRVLQAASGVEALEVWKWHASRIALLLTDLVMPDGLGGVELAARLRAEKPGLKVVLTSGYANEASGEDFRPPSGMHFIQKPYPPQTLALAMRDALADRYHR